MLLFHPVTWKTALRTWEPPALNRASPRHISTPGSRQQQRQWLPWTGSGTAEASGLQVCTSLSWYGACFMDVK